MTAVLPQTTESVDIISIESIKKAFIGLHEVLAANEPINTVYADESHVERVKRAIAPLEFQFKTKVNVVVGAVGGLNDNAAVQLKDGKLFLLANLLRNEKQADDAYFLGVRGYLATKSFVEQASGALVDQIYAGLTDEQKACLSDLSEDRKETVCAYLSHLAMLNIRPSFYERRNSWQRALVRKVYPTLSWTTEDLHYLILQAERRWLKAQKKSQKS